MDLQQLKKQLSKDLNKASNSKDLQDLKIKYLGKKGKISLLSKDLGKLSQSERPQAGKAINLLKTFFEEQSQILSKEIEQGPEGCLSHPGLIIKVRRPISCIVEFDTLTNDYKDVINVEMKLDDIDARIFLHEYDHLHGIQFIDRVSKFKVKRAEEKRLKDIKKAIRNGRT